MVVSPLLIASSHSLKNIFLNKNYFSPTFFPSVISCVCIHISHVLPHPLANTKTKTKFHGCVNTAANSISDKECRMQRLVSFYECMSPFFQIKKIKLLIPLYDFKLYLSPPEIQSLCVHYPTNIPTCIYSCEKNEFHLKKK